jgi:hypothetical protein
MRFPRRTGLWHAALSSSAAAVLLVCLFELFARSALIPLLPTIPSVPDEFSYLLIADTFASGRLANPTHPMWVHFETLFVNQRPTYSSVYPTMQGVFLAAGKLLAGNAWIGVWFSVILLCGAICWMLLAWMPPRWAIFGGLLAVIQFGTFSYWINSCWGGAPAALGGALVFGAFGRLSKGPSVRNALILGLGIFALANSRPYESLFMEIPLLAAMVSRARKGNLREWLYRVGLPLVVALIVGGAATAFYFWRVTGSPWTDPYIPYMKEYAASPIFIWQRVPTPPTYRHELLRDAHLAFRIDAQAYGSAVGIARETFFKIGRTLSFYLGAVFFLPIIMLPWILRDRRVRILVWAVAALFIGMFVLVPFQPHYAAPIASAFLAVTVYSIRRLWVLKRYGNPIGRILVPGCLIACLAVQVLTYTPPRPRLVYKPKIQASLEAQPGKHLVFVRYGNPHFLADEWVYNAADIDKSRVVWARDMGLKGNAELLTYYADRVAWLLEADASPPHLLAYRREP